MQWDLQRAGKGQAEVGKRRVPLAARQRGQTEPHMCGRSGQRNRVTGVCGSGGHSLYNTCEAPLACPACEAWSLRGRTIWKGQQTHSSTSKGLWAHREP